MKTKIKKPYNKWSKLATSIIDNTIEHNFNDTKKIQIVLNTLENYNRSEQAICLKIDKRRTQKFGKDPKYSALL